MSWGDLITIALVLLALWTFIPRHIRRAVGSGLSPALAALLDTLHEAAIVVRKGVASVAYRGLLGVPVPGDVTVNPHDTSDEDDRAVEAVSVAKVNPQTPDLPRPVAETHPQSFTLGETEALARLIAAGKLGLTDAVKIGADAKSGEKYQRRSRDIKAAVDRLQEKYPQRTPEQDTLRKELGLPKP